MGLFDKKYCDICGDKISLLGNRKLDDGNLCRKCASKLSPWFENRRHSTVSEIERHLQYREDNRKRIAEFNITADLDGMNMHVYIDSIHGWFTICNILSPEENPDIVDLSSIRNCRLDIQETRQEDTYTDQSGEEKSYYPPRYLYEYDYYIRIIVDNPWFDNMDFKMNVFSIEDRNRHEMIRYEDAGRRIEQALTMRNEGPSTHTPVTTCSFCGWQGENSPKFCPSCGSPINNR